MAKKKTKKRGLVYGKKEQKRTISRINKTVKKARRAMNQEITIKVQPVAPITERDLTPEQTEGGKYMIPKTWMSERQVVRIVQKTPPQHVYTRPAKGGGRWSYVTGNYVEKVLNYTFGWNWDFEVVGHGREQDQIWVHGKLTVKDDRGHSITKSQFGRADIKFKKGTKEMLDFGNDLKAATTDSLKKCASLLGIASDIYGKMEFKQEAGTEVKSEPIASLPAPTEKKVELKAGQMIGPDGVPMYQCHECGEPITDAEKTFSEKIYKKPLCRECQTKQKK